jgi:hypothetical protein
MNISAVVKLLFLFFAGMEVSERDEEHMVHMGM